MATSVSGARERKAPKAFRRKARKSRRRIGLAVGYQHPVVVEKHAIGKLDVLARLSNGKELPATKAREITAEAADPAQINTPPAWQAHDPAVGQKNCSAGRRKAA
ncbi:MAG TPA: hypothetical protein VL614_25085 [Acetobacteraceae bacterium]|jgi:hypothetical protein|nr:hypothetical protein [Acetobacteraceae bacterium]